MGSKFTPCHLTDDNTAALPPTVMPPSCQARKPRAAGRLTDLQPDEIEHVADYYDTPPKKVPLP